MSVGVTSGGTLKTLLVDLLGRLRIYDDWEPHLESDVTTNDSDKTITVDTDYIWRILSIHIKLATTSTAGNRQIVVEYQDASGNVLYEVRAGAVQAASLTRYYQISVGMSDATSFIDTDLLYTPLTALTLDEAYKIHVYDNNAIDAAADDMEVQILLERRAKEA